MSTNNKTKHTYEKLHGFAKDTPAAELKRVINESHDEKLRKAAHKELDRRSKKEAVRGDAIELATKSLEFYKAAHKGKRIQSAKDLVDSFENNVSIRKSGAATVELSLIKRMLTATFRIIKNNR